MLLGSNLRFASQKSALGIPEQKRPPDAGGLWRLRYKAGYSAACFRAVIVGAAESQLVTQFITLLRYPALVDASVMSALRLSCSASSSAVSRLLATGETRPLLVLKMVRDCS